MYEPFVGTKETVCYIRMSALSGVSLERGSTVPRVSQYGKEITTEGPQSKGQTTVQTVFESRKVIKVLQ